jgi:hypothetical protein
MATIFNAGDRVHGGGRGCADPRPCQHDEGGSGTSNKLMQARVALQFVALVFILLAVYFTRN